MSVFVACSITGLGLLVHFVRRAFRHKHHVDFVMGD